MRLAYQFPGDLWGSDARDIARHEAARHRNGEWLCRECSQFNPNTATWCEECGEDRETP